MTDDAAPDDPARRRFLCRVAGAGAATVGLALAAPPLVVLIGTSSAPSSATPPTSAGTWVDLGSADRFAAGQPPTRVVLKHATRDAWLARPDTPLGAIHVQRLDAERFLVHSARCTHLGCGVTFTGQGFACPCHGATFNTDGSLSGAPDNPAPRPLDTLEWRLDGPNLVVRWQRFRLDTPTKDAVG